MSAIDCDRKNKQLDVASQTSKEQQLEAIVVVDQSSPKITCDQFAPTNLASTDKLVISDALLTLRKAIQNLDTEAGHEQRLADLKLQVANGALPIMSDDPKVRKAAAWQVTAKIIAFERQLYEALD